MITNIYLVRHAHSTYTPEELSRPLSERGLKDAKKVTKLLLEDNITYVISSPYRRAIQSVEGIANILGLDILIDDGFRERQVAYNSVDNFDEVILKYWQNFEFAFPGGETGYLVQHRGVKFLENILDKCNRGNIAIGTHGNIMVLIMNHMIKNIITNSGLI